VASPTAIASAPPEPPSPITETTIGTRSPAISKRFLPEGEQRDRELLRQPHEPQRLAVALGARHAEVAQDLLVGVAALLVTHHHDALPVEPRQPAHDGRVVREGAVAVHLLEIRAHGLDVVEGVGALRVARDLGDLPGGELAVDVLGELAALLRQPLDLLRDVDGAVVLDEAQLLDLLLEFRDGLFEVEEGGLHEGRAGDGVGNDSRGADAGGGREG